MPLKRRKRPKMGVREPSQIRSDGHLKFVRGFNCLIAGKHECQGHICAHHISAGGDSGVGVKASDCYTVPLCAVAHDEVHRGHETFEGKYTVDLLAEAAKLWRQSPHRIRMEKRNAQD